MRGIILVGLWVSLVGVCPALAQEMRVKAAKGKEVVIEDRATGEAWRVTEGEMIEGGWKVVEVTDHLVTLEREDSAGMKVRKQMPVDAFKITETP